MHQPWFPLIALGLCGCGLVDANILDTTITLQTQTYTQDFGSNNGTVPQVSCTAATASLCSAAGQAITASNATVTGQCDTTQSECYAAVAVTLPYPVNLSNDTAFQSGIGQKAVQSVQTITLAYTVPTNTLNFALPEIDLYVGPASASAVTDSGVAPIGKISSIAAGQTSASGALQVQSGSAAFTLLQNAITTPKTPIVFLLATDPHIYPGAAPAGKVTVNVTPSLVVGLPR